VVAQRPLAAGGDEERGRLITLAGWIVGFCEKLEAEIEAWTEARPPAALEVVWYDCGPGRPLPPSLSDQAVIHARLTRRLWGQPPDLQSG